MMKIMAQMMALVFSVMMNFGWWAPESLVIENIPEKNTEAVRIVSFNVRCADDLYGSVKVRSQLIVSALEQYYPDSFGVQEATGEWIEILRDKLGSEYGCVSQTRDGSDDDEASAVFYLKNKYNLLDSGTVWLSDTPDETGSKFAFSTYPRIATWVTLENKETGEVYTHINTHLDHLFECVRVDQVKVLCEKIKELQQAGHPVFCTGDFNTDQGADAYEVMTELMTDSKLVAKVSDDGPTYTNYGHALPCNPPIDFVFVPEGTQVDTYKIIDEKIGGMYLSDHAGLCVDLYI